MNPSKGRAQRRALERMLHTTDLASVVPQLPPDVLHRAIQRRGLEDCVELVSLITPQQLTELFDLDLWRAPQPGEDEKFDPGRFGLWISVLLEAGASVAAQKLSEIDVDVLVTGLAQHVRVFDLGAVSEYETTDGQIVIPAATPDDVLHAELGAFVLGAKRLDAWEAIVSVLRALGEKHPAHFQEVMSECVRLSDSTPEVDGLDNLLQRPDQAMYDTATGRDARREPLGYVSAPDARAFLKTARNADARSRATPAELRAAAGALALRPEGADPESVLAFLANTLMAGCSFQGRPFTAQEAWDAAGAVCDLGREAPQPAGDAAADRDLMSAFRRGWTTLHDDVVMHAAAALVDVLKKVKVDDREIQSGINKLRTELTRQLRAGTPWKAREAMDVLASLDLMAHAMLQGLIDECPVVVTKGATAFEFISTKSQIESIHAFVHSLAEQLSC